MILAGVITRHYFEVIMIDTQVLYMGRWVSREHFKAFVYNNEGQKLAKSYQEFIDLISSGVWQAEPLNAQSASQEEDNVVPIKAKRGRKCQNQRKG